jgi:ATP-dependent DNA helicase RecQ
MITDRNDPLADAVKTFFGHPYLLPYQRLVVSNVLEAAQSAGIPIHWPNEPKPQPCEPLGDYSGAQIVVLPTGAGKSLCFQAPAMLLEGVTLVIFPLLSLMADQEQHLLKCGITPLVLRGGQSEAELNATCNAARSGRHRIIIANPEILLSARIFGRLGTFGIVHVVIDEAHCVSEWGESFRPSYLEVGKIIAATKAPLVSAFTATASADVLEKIDRYVFAGGGARRILANPDRPNIHYATLGCILRDMAVRDLLCKHQRPAIVFCSSREGTQNLACCLREDLNDKEIRFYHAGLERAEKRLLEEWFLKSTKGVLVATCAYGMGIDKPDLRLVIHRDVPPSVESYLQETGRAGRDGLPANAILLWGPYDTWRLSHIANTADKQRLSAVLNYARDTSSCRRAALLHLLDYEGDGDNPPDVCCDVCDGSTRGALREERLLSFFKQNPRRYDIIEAAKLFADFHQYAWTILDAILAIQGLIDTNKLRASTNPLWKRKLTCVRKPAKIF